MSPLFAEDLMAKPEGGSATPASAAVKARIFRQGCAGSESVLAKLSELMFIEVVRRHMESMPAERAGWLAGLRDPFVGRALALMHGSPTHDWTIGELGKKVGLSRSVLAERFTDLLGMPPMQYLARWRMQIAASILSDASTNIASIAEEIGYESEAAFSRAFKKLVGVPPSEWRRRTPASARDFGPTHRPSPAPARAVSTPR